MSIESEKPRFSEIVVEKSVAIARLLGERVLTSIVNLSSPDDKPLDMPAIIPKTIS